MILTNKELNLLAYLRKSSYKQQNEQRPKRRKVKGEYMSFFPDTVHNVQLRDKAGLVDLLKARLPKAKKYLKRGTANASFWRNEILIIEPLIKKLEA